MGPHHGMRTPGNYNVRPINSGYPPQGYVMHQQQRYPVMYQQVQQQNHYPAPLNTPPMYNQQGHLVSQPGHVMVQQQNPNMPPQQHPNMPPQQRPFMISRGQAPNVRAQVMAPPKYGAKGTRTKGKASPRMQNSPQAPSPQAPQMSPASQPPLMEMDTSSSPAGAPAPIYPEEDILMPSEQVQRTPDTSPSPPYHTPPLITSPTTTSSIITSPMVTSPTTIDNSLPQNSPMDTSHQSPPTTQMLSPPHSPTSPHHPPTSPPPQSIDLPLFDTPIASTNNSYSDCEEPP